PTDDRRAKPQTQPNERPQTTEAFPKADDAEAKATRQGEPAPPGTLINPASASDRRLAADHDPRRRAIDAPPADAASADRLTAQTAKLNERGEAELPTPVNRRAEDKAVLEAPNLPPDRRSNPSPRARRMENDDPAPRLAALLRNIDVDLDPTSPKNRPPRPRTKATTRRRRTPRPKPKRSPGRRTKARPEPSAGRFQSRASLPRLPKTVAKRTRSPS
ncbi:MAG: hypothetical protein R3236_11530, partial [Phycisphaeraceae bacterium]|nr:hypothetical protein [Phycisphaeraceae bacterium]